MLSIKEKIHAVRAVVDSASNDQIVLVLQHNDDNVEKTISDFVEGRSKDILTEWQQARPTKPKNKKKKKKSQKKQKQPDNINGHVAMVNGESESVDDHVVVETQTAEGGNACQTHQSTTAEALKHLLTHPSPLEESSIDPLIINPEITPNGVDITKPSLNGKIQTKDALNPISDLPNETIETPKQPIVTEKPVNPPKSQNPLKMEVKHLYHAGQRSRTSSESSVKRSANKKHHKSNLTSQDIGSVNQIQGNNPFNQNKKSIEKATKDLQRCSASFGRYRSLLKAEVNDSYKRIKEVFEELNGALQDREVELLRKLDALKEEAFNNLESREHRAQELKRQTDRFAGMQPHQVTEIRGEIKQFVADRKFDEELSRTTRFTYDKEVLTKVIPNFGAISAVKDTYPHSKPRVRNESAASTNSDIVAPAVSTAMASISATPALASAVSTSNMPSSTNCATKPLLNPLSSKASATDAITTSAVPPAHLPLHFKPHAPQETQKSTPTLKTLEKKASTDSLKLEEDTIDWDKRGPLESPVSWADESPTPQLEDSRPNKMYPRDENGLMPPPNFTPWSAPRGRGRYRGRGNHPGNQGRKFHNNDIYANPLDEPPKHRGDFHKRDPRPAHKKETRQYETHQRKPLQNRPQDNAPESQDHIHRSENHPKSQPHKQDASHQNDQHRQNNQREFPLPQRNRSSRNQRVNNTRDFGGPRKRGDFSQRGNRNQKTSDDLIKNEANS